MSVATVEEENFAAEVLEADRAVLVDFWAPWCGPCRMVEPIVEDLAWEYSDRLKFVKMNIDENPKIAEQYEIRSVPTLAVFQKGEIKDRLVGLRPKNQLREDLERYLF